MKDNTKMHINSFMVKLKKFAARWEQLKPKDIDMDGDMQACEVSRKICSLPFALISIFLFLFLTLFISYPIFFISVSLTLSITSLPCLSSSMHISLSYSFCLQLFSTVLKHCISTSTVLKHCIFTSTVLKHCIFTNSSNRPESPHLCKRASSRI